MSMTDKYGLETLDYGVTGWDGILTANFQKLEANMHDRRLVTLGETVTAYKPVYMANDGKCYQAQGILEKQPCIGITLESGVLDEQVRIQRRGTVTNALWSWTVGRLIYLDPGVLGGLTMTRPSVNIQMVGIASDTDEIFLEGNSVVQSMSPAPTSTSTTTTSSSTNSTTSTTA